jgi:hypothetical protein
MDRDRVELGASGVKIKGSILDREGRENSYRAGWSSRPDTQLKFFDNKNDAREPDSLPASGNRLRGGSRGDHARC